MTAEVPVTQVQQIGASTGTSAGQPGRSFLPLYVKKGSPPFMKQHKRYDYLSEYVGYEKDRYKNMAKAIFCFVFGILTLQAFPPGGLLMIALAARFQDIAWMDAFITRTFGKYRSIVLVD